MYVSGRTIECDKSISEKCSGATFAGEKKDVKELDKY